MCESFFATLECELLDRNRFKTYAEAKMVVFVLLKAGIIRIGSIQRSATNRRRSMRNCKSRQHESNS